VLPAGQYDPAGHTPEQFGVSIPTVLPKYPLTHGLHDDDDDADEYCPAGHTVIMPFTQNEPAGQSTHTVPFTAYSPGSHRVPLTLNALTPHTDPDTAVQVNVGLMVPAGQKNPTGQAVHVDTVVCDDGW
jgi:hypothetical protein